MSRRTRKFDSLGVVVVTHTIRFLDECLRSIADQTVPPTAVVVVDNASPAEEGVVDLALSFGFDAIRSERDNPHQTARNLGIQILDGCDLVANFDGDDVMLPRFVEVYWQTARDHRVDIVYGCAEFIGTRSGVFGADFGRPLSQLRRGNFIPANSVFSRALWREVGGFDPAVGLIDDWDFWLSCVQKGATARFVDQPLWQYRRHPDSNLAPGQPDLEARRADSVAVVRAKHFRYINGVLGWRGVARSIDRHTGRVRRGLRRRISRTASYLRPGSAQDSKPSR